MFNPIKLLRRPFCNHKDSLEAEADVSIGDNLLMDMEFILTCSRCGKKWRKTNWEMINQPFEEW